MTQVDLEFNSTDKHLWLSKIMEYKNYIFQRKDIEDIKFNFPNIEVRNLNPLHIVSLACLIEHIDRKNIKISLDNTSVGKYLFNSLKFREYWAGGKDYSSADDENTLNLWRLKETQKDLYGKSVADYLKKKFNSKKDLSAVELSITEAFYNVCDHAYAKNNAFSFIQFDAKTQILQIAVCDFGIGIGCSVKKILHNISDQEALKKAIEPKFTVKSKNYNAGMGLDSIRNSSTEDQNLTIVSNGAFLVAKGDSVKTRDLGFNFEGTLVYYKINLNHYEDADTDLDSLDFDYL